MIYNFNNKRIKLNHFFETLQLIKENKIKFQINKNVLIKIEKDFVNVKQGLASGKSVYGMNTGLGGNVNYKLNKQEIENFQQLIIEGRSSSVGKFLDEDIGLLLLYARCIQLSKGNTGISPSLFKHLVKCLEKGLSPAIPEFGSIGAGDLTQNATFGLALLGKGKFWNNGKIINSKNKLVSNKIKLPKLEGKDAMVLINHSCLSIALTGKALSDTLNVFMMMQFSALFSFEAFIGNKQIFSPEVNELRVSPGQNECARWYDNIFKNILKKPRRLQDPLSFRTISVCHGLGMTNITRLIEYWENELNGISDSPVVLNNKDLVSTPNFHNPALAQIMESVALSNAMIANGSFQRIQKLMNNKISDLPSFLSPMGGKSAGLMPLQKTAASILSEIRQCAFPISFDTSPVSDTVEDMSTMTPSSAKKLIRQSELMKLLSGIETLVSCQALDLRHDNISNSKLISSPTKLMFKIIRKTIDKILIDRPIENDIETTAVELEEFIKSKKLKKFWIFN